MKWRVLFLLSIIHGSFAANPNRVGRWTFEEGFGTIAAESSGHVNSSMDSVLDVFDKPLIEFFY